MQYENAAKFYKTYLSSKESFYREKKVKKTQTNKYTYANKKCKKSKEDKFIGCVAEEEKREIHFSSLAHIPACLSGQHEKC